MSQLVLSLFPGIGLLDMAFELEGFCVVRGPDLLWGGDIKNFHPPAGRFDGVIGGPPCQAFSRLRALVLHNGLELGENLIPEFERVVAAAAPAWFLMENVSTAPRPVIHGYASTSVLLRDSLIGGVTSRVRAFWCGGTASGATVANLALRPIVERPAVVASGGCPDDTIARKWRKGRSAMGYKTDAYWRIARRDQGLPADFDLPPFTVKAKIHAVGNGVPLPMGRAIARAVRQALGLPLVEREEQPA